MDIAEFITARLDEWEQRGRQALPYQTGSRDEGQPPEHVSWRRGPGSVEFGLRHVATLRAIVALHGRMSILPGHPMFNDAHLTRLPMILCRSCEPETMWRREKSWPCRTLRAIAADWSTHPDYSTEWKP